jgi:hypothetical protein
MWKNDSYEVSVWNFGSEARFWEWRKGTWRVFEHFNYRHRFQEYPITPEDITALRKHFNISDTDMSDEELLQRTPDELEPASERVKG